MSAPTAARPVTAERTGRRIEEVLDRLAATGEGAAAAEELVRSLMELYGTALARVVELLDPAPGGPLAELLADDLVASLLVLHDLHPEDRDTRIARALDGVHDPRLEVVGFEEHSGTLRLRARAGGGCGCGSAGDAARAAETALAGLAPEVRAVDVETTPAGPTLLQIGTAPTGAR
ncbi:hypothetical protein [Streptomyces sp. DSM 15324]|uniref:hypothetical protein n=1 Tax=Streptomyces sp. DSM 15324 TaxID=1739111 RepID=UPI0007489898|nr:hypothetical protein [Streptomyces sp. DSM 15324]KUO07767.1 hypothetical protein AQJ58_32880 [Streptomyces sp. DSM 15324]